MSSLEDAKLKLTKAKSILATVSYVRVGDPITSSLHNKLVDVSKNLSDALDSLADYVEGIVAPPTPPPPLPIYAGYTPSLNILAEAGITSSLRETLSKADYADASRVGHAVNSLKEVLSMANYVDVKETEQVVHEEKTKQNVIHQVVGQLIRQEKTQQSIAGIAERVSPDKAIKLAEDLYAEQQALYAPLVMFKTTETITITLKWIFYSGIIGEHLTSADFADHVEGALTLGKEVLSMANYVDVKETEQVVYEEKTKQNAVYYAEVVASVIREDKTKQDVFSKYQIDDPKTFKSQYPDLQQLVDAPESREVVKTQDLGCVACVDVKETEQVVLDNLPNLALETDKLKFCIDVILSRASKGYDVKSDIEEHEATLEREVCYVTY